MRIIDLHPGYDQIIQHIAEMLVDSFNEHSPDAWPTMESALEEVGESFGEDRISRVAVDDSGTVMGWAGAIKTYDGNVWELQPMQGGTASVVRWWKILKIRCSSAAG